jgi:hypothetical protein
MPHGVILSGASCATKDRKQNTLQNSDVETLRRG